MVRMLFCHLQEESVTLTGSIMNVLSLGEWKNSNVSGPLCQKQYNLRTSFAFHILYRKLQ